MKQKTTKQMNINYRHVSVKFQSQNLYMKLTHISMILIPVNAKSKLTCHKK